MLCSARGKGDNGGITSSSAKTQKHAHDAQNSARRAPQEDKLRRVVLVLTQNPTVVVSGTRISEEIGASRSAIWRIVQHLRGFGVQIEGHPTTGYLLKQVPDL